MTTKSEVVDRSIGNVHGTKTCAGSISSFIQAVLYLISMLPPEMVLLTLKIAVITVTLLLLSSLVALARGNYRLHGRINMVFFALTLTAVAGLEVVIRVIEPEIFDEFIEQRQAGQTLTIHLMFSMPAALLLPVMLFTGLRHMRRVHLTLASIFSVLWAGTFITGVFFLPHR